MEVINALGRRKSAVARVYVTKGKGNIVINSKPLEEYFREEILRFIVRQPLMVTDTLSQFDIKVCEVDKEAYRPVLKSNGFLTRDARRVERKKPGRPGARKRFQFSKR